ncbi:50S ribosomal protein L19 [Blattabacterium cuenoti]|uniref:50S ribosomal protein L19 n=1 Tax=Blattabacterium cuenoti TaxID=1653831 RepID=UPI00163C9292|nr:50S ribosomal protein L19 [Blattabacterium cuenoti]
MQSIIKYVENKFIENKNFPVFNSGDTITVLFEIKEGEKTRIQSFKGIVIKKKGKGINKTFTIRKISLGIGVERIFYINQPNITKIAVNKIGKCRRSKIYYFRFLKGKKAKMR